MELMSQEKRKIGYALNQEVVDELDRIVENLSKTGLKSASVEAARMQISQQRGAVGLRRQTTSTSDDSSHPTIAASSTCRGNVPESRHHAAKLAHNKAAKGKRK